MDGGATLDGGVLSLSKIGRIPIRLHRSLERHPQDRHDLTRGRRVVCLHFLRGCACATVAATGQETGIDLGIEAFATLSDGTRIFQPRLVPQSRAGAENGATACLTTQEGEQSQAQGSQAARQGASDSATPTT